MPMFLDGQDPRDAGAPAPTRGAIGAPSADPFAPPPTISDVAGAAFRQDNPIVSVIEAIANQSPDHAFDPNHNPLDLAKGTPFEQNPSALLDSPNEATTRAIIAQRQRQDVDGATLARSGTAGTVARLAAGGLDPSYFLPIFGELHAAGTAASFARSALRAGATGAAQSAVSEAALQASQVSRKWTEAPGNIATNTLLMGVLGGAAGALSRGERTAAVDAMEAVRRDATPVNPADPASPSLHDHVTPGDSGFSGAVEQRAAELHAAGVGETPLDAAHAAIIERIPEDIAHEVDGGAAQEGVRAAAERGGGGAEPDAGGDPGEPGAGLGSDGGPTLAAGDDAGGAGGDAGAGGGAGVGEGGAGGTGPSSGSGGGVQGPSGGGGPQAAGADISDARDLRLKSFGIDKVPGLNKANAQLSPNLRVYSGDSVQAKRTMAGLADTGLRFTQHDRGVPTSPGGTVETLVRQDKARFLAATHEALQRLWTEHRYGGEAPGRVQRGLDAVADARGQTPDGKLSYKDFKSAVYDALYSGDQHPIPEVEQAAREVRAQVLDPLAKRAQETMGPDGRPMLGDALTPPKGDQSFAPRMWNKEAAIPKRYQFVQRVTDWLGSEQATKAAAKDRIGGFTDDLKASSERLAALAEDDPARAHEQATHDGIRAKIEKEISDWQGSSSAEAKAALAQRAERETARQGKIDEGSYRGKAERLTAADDAVDGAVRDILASDRDLGRGELQDLADQIVDRIIGSPDGRIPYDVASGGPKVGFTGGPQQQVRGSLNSRDFAIPTALVRDFVHTDVEHVIASHLRTMLPDIELTRRFGDVDLTDPLRRIQEEYARKIGPNTTEKEARAINAARDGDIRDVAAVRDRVRGVYGWNPDPSSRRLANIVRDFHMATSLSSLGSSVLNRFNDLGGQAVMRHGLMNTFSDAWRPYFKSMLGMSPLAGIAKKQAAEMGVGIDGLLGHLRHNLSDINESYMPGNKFSRGLAWANDRSMIVNMHGPWTDYTKAMGWTVAQAELGRVADRVAQGKGTAKDLSALADANLDPHLAARISQQLAAHSTTVDGVRLASTGEWTDMAAREAFERTLSQEVNRLVMTGGAGTTPLFVSKPIGSLIGQFKSFTAAAHENILIANLQQRDGRTLQGLLVSVAMGMLGYRLYTLASGQTASERPQDWIKEGLARSAITGWFNEENNLLAKFTAGKLDYNRLYGADRPLTRRTENSPLSELLGPTYARLEGLTGIGVHLASGKGSAADIHQLRQALPLQNLMGARILFDDAEDGASNAFGVKPRNRTPTAWPGGPTPYPPG